MRAKKLNLQHPDFHQVSVTGNSGTRLVCYVKVMHNGSRFHVTEAYAPISGNIFKTDVAGMLGELNNITDRWYNASLEPQTVAGVSTIWATGYVSILRNHEHVGLMEQVEEYVVNMKTRRERKMTVSI